MYMEWAQHDGNAVKSIKREVEILERGVGIKFVRGSGKF
jgi:hypothetical protein